MSLVLVGLCQNVFYKRGYQYIFPDQKDRNKEAGCIHLTSLQYHHDYVIEAVLLRNLLFVGLRSFFAYTRNKPISGRHRKKYLLFESPAIFQQKSDYSEPVRDIF